MTQQQDAVGMRMASLIVKTTCAALAASMATTCHSAEYHGLILWAGRYAQLAHALPGVEHDVERARDIARALGVPDRQREEIGDNALTRDNVQQALARLEQRVALGDHVFIYFSGHGRQIAPVVEGSRCTEGIVTHDGWLVADVTIEAWLHRLAAKAAQVVMVNDSCHAGGAATRTLRQPAPDEVSKAYPEHLPVSLASNSSGSTPEECGRPVNGASVWSRTLPALSGGSKTRRPGTIVYLAAAAADELAFASPAGSRATRAWHACLASGAADLDRDGQISADEWRKCAQRLSDIKGRARQTITIVGSRKALLFPADRR